MKANWTKAKKHHISIVVTSVYFPKLFQKSKKALYNIAAFVFLFIITP